MARNKRSLRWFHKRLGVWKTRGIQITYAEYCKLWVDQGRKCKICGKPLRLWYVEEMSPIIYKNMETANVDHDHASGKIRGLLCSHCNRTVGIFETDNFFIKIEKYLSENS